MKVCYCIGGSVVMGDGGVTVAVHIITKLLLLL